MTLSEAPMRPSSVDASSTPATPTMAATITPSAMPCTTDSARLPSDRTSMKPLAILLLAVLTACSDNIMSAPPPPPPPPTTISVAYCTGLEPMWVAFQDGDGAWTRALPTVSNGKVVFQSGFASDRGGIATVFRAGSGIAFLGVLFGVPEELGTVSDTSPRFCGPPIVKSLVGSVAGGDSKEFVIGWAGSDAQTRAP